MIDMENAALVVLLSLLTRAILSFGIDLRIAISCVQINIQRAQMRNAIQQTKFHFPQKIFQSKKFTFLDRAKFSLFF